MSTFTVTFLTRNSNGRFERFTRKIPAEDFEEVESWVAHGCRHGKWTVESEVTASKLGGETKTFGF